MIILSALESIISIIIMIAIGCFLTYKKWFDEKMSVVFTKLVCNLSLPCFMISNVVGNFDKNKIVHLSKGAVIPFLSMAVTYLIAIAVSKIIKVKKGRIGTFRSMFFVSNCIFIGLPINMALFGSKSIPYALIYYMANTTFFWTIGSYGIYMDGQNSKGGHQSIFSMETFKRIFSPPLIGFIVAIILIILNIHLPKFILDTCKYFGNLTTPLSMLFIGITLYSFKSEEIKLDKDMLAVLLGRFLASPLLIFISAYYLPVPALMKKVFVIQAAMPVMTNTAIVARSYNADYKYATVMTLVTTVLSAVFIPLYMVLLG